MFTISLHQVKIEAPVGLYSQEHILGNRFEVDIDVHSEVSSYEAGYFVDYALLNTTIQNAFKVEWKTLEEVVVHIHAEALRQFPFVQKVRVVLRKLSPPMPGNIGFAQVVFER